MSSYQSARPRSEAPLGRGSISEPSSTSSKRILVVDDEPAIRAMLTRALSQEGYLVSVASDGEEAWRAVQAKRHVGVIVDLKMRGLGGQQFWERLETWDKRLVPRVIFMTGDTARYGTRAFIPATGNPLVEKPFDLVEFLRVVQRHFEADSGGE